MKFLNFLSSSDPLQPHRGGIPRPGGQMLGQNEVWFGSEAKR
jgi:hypothetical protein